MTNKQKRVYDFICSYIEKNGVAPTYNEIMQELNIKWKSTVFNYLDNLERQKKIVRNPCITRGIKVCRDYESEINKLNNQLSNIKASLKVLLAYLKIPGIEVATVNKMVEIILKKEF